MIPNNKIIRWADTIKNENEMKKIKKKLNEKFYSEDLINLFFNCIEFDPIKR